MDQVVDGKSTRRVESGQAVVDSIENKFRGRTATVGVIGLGYVGLPLLCLIAERGFTALGFDTDPAKVEKLNGGDSYITHISSESIAVLRKSGRFCATDDFRRLSKADAIIICVPTPLSRQREPNLDFVVSTANAIARQLRPGQLVVLESTTYPGTSRELVLPILEGSGLRPGHDFFLAFSPEREDPGNRQFSTSNIPKVIGADGAQALQLACALYEQLVPKTVAVSSLDVAEAVKLTENIFRSVNIALVNELKIIFEAMGIDIWEVIEAAKTKPFGYMPFYPGPGLGGHCIPIDPFYLTWKARQFGIATRFIELAGEINVAMPQRVVDRLIDALSERFGRAVKGARVLIVGFAYKKNIDDPRESPAFKLMELLERRGATVSFHDPFLAEIPASRDHPEFSGLRSVAADPATIAGYEAAIICTDHDAFDYANLVAHCPLVIDTRNVCARLGLANDRVVKA